MSEYLKFVYYFTYLIFLFNLFLLFVTPVLLHNSLNPTQKALTIIEYNVSKNIRSPTDESLSKSRNHMTVPFFIYLYNYNGKLIFISKLLSSFHLLLCMRQVQPGCPFKQVQFILYQTFTTWR